MSTIKLKGSSSGEAEVTVAAAAGTPTFTLPTTVGSANQLVKNSGTAGTLEYSSGLTYNGSDLTLQSQYFYIKSPDGGNRYFFGETGNSQSAQLSLYDSSNAQKVRIAAGDGASQGATYFNGGNVGIGETSPANLLHVKVSDTGISPHASSQIVLERSGTNYLQFLTANTGTSGILFGDSDDVDVSAIKYDHNASTLQFNRNASEAFRIGANENMFIHCTNSSGSAGRIYTNKGSSDTTIFEINQNAGGSTEMITFRKDGSQLGTIHQSGSGVNYQSNSDYRLKQDDVVISDGITRVKQLRPIRFKWKSDTDRTVDGFFAHEVSPVVPESVRGNKDEIFDTDGVGAQVKGGPKYQQLDQSKLVPLLTAALKEAITKIETLETKVAALEAK